MGGPTRDRSTLQGRKAALFTAVGDASTSMAARSTPYEAKHEIDGLEGLSNKLTTDMRRHVRMLVSACRGWLALAAQRSRRRR